MRCSSPRSIPIPKPSQTEKMWGVYMNEVRKGAGGDFIHSQEYSLSNTDKYEGVDTHPVAKYEKDINYPHLPLPTNAIPKQLRFTDWKNRK